MIIDTKTWLRSGLARSAFKPSIYRNLPLDFYIPGINAAHEYYHAMRKERKTRIVPKFYMIHDAYMMFHHPHDHVASSLKKKPRNPSAWWRLVREAVTSRDYIELNRVTAGSTELAALAAARFLIEIFEEIDHARKKAGVSTASRSAAQYIHESSDNAVEALAAKAGVKPGEIANRALKAAAEAVKEYARLSEEAIEAIKVLAAGGEGYNHDALSVLEFLKKPDRFRERVEILKSAVLAMRVLSKAVPSSVEKEQTVSAYGGVTGVTKMEREAQLRDILPSELALVHSPIPARIARALLVAKLASKQVLVKERAATIKPVVFVDRSGSMGMMLKDGIPKISAAAGLALALYRKLGAEVYLFDTEVEKVSPAKVVETLLKISAGGGTRIEEVLREILRIGSKDRVYIVITDAIDDVDDEVIEELKSRGLARLVRFIVIPPMMKPAWLTENFKYFEATRLADFATATPHLLRR